MKINKTITITAPAKEIKIIGNFLTLFDDMHEETWHELNNITDCRLEDALAVINEIYDILEEDAD